jgi:hypothetical protein
MGDWVGPTPRERAPKNYETLCIMCYVVPCRVFGLWIQIWRLAANILNKQTQTADKGWSYGFGFFGADYATEYVLYDILQDFGDET